LLKVLICNTFNIKALKPEAPPFVLGFRKIAIALYIQEVTNLGKICIVPVNFSQLIQIFHMPEDNANEPQISQSANEAVFNEVLKSIDIDPALLAELGEVTNDPEQAIDTAIRQWLQRRAIKEADRSRPLTMNPVVPPRGEWND
jgi:hypothetical protein